jgi:lipopolysaccharide cholinephosphotransferase
MIFIDFVIISLFVVVVYFVLSDICDNNHMSNTNIGKGSETFIKNQNLNHKSNNESNRFKYVRSRDVTTIYKLLYLLDKIFRENKIEYWIEGGTLLGAVRHKGLIPWDNDGDIEFWEKDIKKIKALEAKFKKYNVVLMKTWFGYKIFFSDGKPIKGFKWLFPAIDLFPMKKSPNGSSDKLIFSYKDAQKLFGYCSFKANEMYPLERYDFGSFQLTGISKKYVKQYLDKCYGEDWADFAYEMFDHENERKKKKIKIKLTKEEKKPAMPIWFDKSDLI